MEAFIESERQLRATDPYYSGLIKAVCPTPEQAAQARKAPQRSPEWHKARLGMITASTAGVFCRTPDGKPLNPYGSTDETIDQIVRGTQVKVSASARAAMDRGIAMEPRVRELYCQKLAECGTPVEIEEDGFVVSSELPWLAVSPDGIVHRQRPDGKDDEASAKRQGPSSWLMEIKAPKDGKNYRSIPPYYWLQMQLQMFVMGMAQCDFVVYLTEGGERVAISVVHYDPNQLAVHLRQLRAYWISEIAPRIILEREGVNPVDSKQLSAFLDKPGLDPVQTRVAELAYADHWNK